MPNPSLLPSPAPALIKTEWLSCSALDDIMALQQAVNSDLRSTGNSHFLVPVTRQAREEIILNDHHVAGLRCDGQLVAHITFYSLEKFNLLRARYHSLTMKFDEAGPNDFYVISEMVHPDYRQRGYLKMLASWAMTELFFETPHLNPSMWATVSSVNMIGLHCNLGLGMKIVDEGLNRFDGTPVCLLKGKLFPEGTVQQALKSYAA